MEPQYGRYPNDVKGLGGILPMEANNSEKCMCSRQNNTALINRYPCVKLHYIY